MDLTVALAQQQIRPLRPETNFSRMEAFIADAATRQADLVVFPEDAVAGPLEGQTAFADQGPAFLERCRDMAMRHGVDLVPGTWTMRDGDRLYNTAVYITRTGEIAGQYRKVHLWPTEQAALTPGAETTVFDTPHGRVGLVICWDLAFPGLFGAMRRQGVDLVVCPAFWSFTGRAPAVVGALTTEVQLIDSLCTSRAFENSVALAFCNAAGRVELDGAPTVLCGRSQIVQPGGRPGQRAAANGEELVIARVRVDRVPAHAAGWA